MKKLILFGIVFVLLAVNVYSWSATGRVLDQQGNSLPGANVVAKDINGNILVGATANVNGNFVLDSNNVQGRVAVTASFIGYADKTEFLNSGQNNVFRLTEIVYNLPELVVIGEREPENIPPSSGPTLPSNYVYLNSLMEDKKFDYIQIRKQYIENDFLSEVESRGVFFEDRNGVDYYKFNPLLGLESKPIFIKPFSEIEFWKDGRLNEKLTLI